MTQDYLKSKLKYNKKTGIFTWNKNNKVAGTLDLGYVRIGIDGKKYRAHRLAWLYVYGSFPKNDIDHINRDKKDNRIVNLREATKKENANNVDKNKRNSSTLKGRQRKTNKSGYTGVRFEAKSKRWYAEIKINKKRIGLGGYLSKEEAIIARKKAESFYSIH